MLKKLFVACFLSGVFLSVNVLAQNKESTKKITVGLISTTTQDETKKRWQPLLDALEKRVNVKTELIVSTNYADILKSIQENKVQVAWLSNKLALEAIEDGKAAIFVQMVKLDGSRGYKSVLITPASNPIQKLDDVLAKRGAYSFSNGDPKSTSGFLVPSYYVFAKNKATPEQVFNKILSGNHKSNFMAVARGEVDVATNNTEDLERFKTEMPDQFRKIRVFWESPLIPNDPLLYRTDLSLDLRTRLQEFFVNYGKNGTNEEAKVLKDILGLSGFKVSNNVQLKPIADIELFNALHSGWYDEKLTPEQRQKNFDALMARFGKLGVLLELDRGRTH
jgi:phosphonate transport system substrate-binding protein